MKESHHTPFLDSDQFEIHEVEVPEGGAEDIHKNLDRSEPNSQPGVQHKSRKQRRLERKLERIEQRSREKAIKKEMKKKKEGYHWAFFLASFFIGLGFTAAADSPLPMFMGLGIGFLFFVDPIYQRVIQIFEN